MQDDIDEAPIDEDAEPAAHRLHDDAPGFAEYDPALHAWHTLGLAAPESVE